MQLYPPQYLTALRIENELRKKVGALQTETCALHRAISNVRLARDEQDKAYAIKKLELALAPHLEN